METTKPDNELIAEFMGMKHQIQVGPFGGEYLYVKNPVTKEFEIPKFEISWDWLMPVVEKIDQTIKNTHWIKGYWFVHELSITTPINELYKYVVEFIKWHNSQKL